MSLRIPALLTALLAAATGLSTGANGQPAFQPSASALGVDHRWGNDTLSGDLGGGVALDDFDRDGDLDLFLATKRPGSFVLFERDGESFFDATSARGLPPMLDIKQILLVDLDDDGWRELLLTAWGRPVRLFANDAGIFREVEGAGGLARVIDGSFHGLGTGAACGDIDLDGDLDVYISYWKIGPAGPEARNALYRNEGLLLFTDISAGSGTDSHRKSYQPLLSDLTGDGRVDLLVAHDKGGGTNFWMNSGGGQFVDATEFSGLSGVESNTNTSIDGMGIACGDYDGDLLPDVYITNIETGNVLYRARAPGLYEEVAIPSGTLMQRNGWGTTFLDADRDGWLDLYVGNFSPSADALFLNQRDGSFVDVGVAAGVGLARATLGLAAGDIDRDGDIDVVASYNAADTEILRNEGGDGLHWIAFELEGVRSNRDAVGAVVTVTANGRAQRRERRAGISYLSMDDGRLHFGLGTAVSCERVEISWPSGEQHSFENLEVDACYGLNEDGVLGACEPHVSPAPPELRLRSAGSNPLISTGPEPVLLELAGLPANRSSAVRLEIFDARGRLIRGLQFASVRSSDPILQWDGRDDAGHGLPSGIYRLRAEAGGQSASTTITLLR